ncbi:copper resistance CopC family protein [Micromonospora sp. DT48]|uniref:copper resistance CopC family protein n=1 Tax=unclassified Micromonospora TaxID=2617518 RepID=UPI0012BC6E5A|nr:copper resistance CopC family protein [Micromonospora sp. CP22]MTK03432.1 copper resistance protein CopC [Micromonospora sp. CP22]
MPTHARPSFAGLLAATLTTVTLLLVPAVPAAAHNTLKSATPPKNAQLTSLPKEITLEFMQELNPAYTTITLSDAAQQKVSTSEPAVTGTKGTITIDQVLTNGTYTVAYRVVSADGHPVQGSYQFTVADPTASPDAAASATTAPTAAPSTTPSSSTAASSAVAARDTDDGPGAPLLIGGAILAAMIIAAGTVVVARRRSTRES